MPWAWAAERSAKPRGLRWLASEVSGRVLDYTAVDIGRAEVVIRKPVADERQCWAIDGPADTVIVPLGIDTLNARAASGDQDAVAVRVAVVSAALNAEERGGRANAVVGV